VELTAESVKVELLVDDDLMRDFSVLSDVEFEELCADLLQTTLDVAVLRYAKGKDKGKDLIWTEDAGLGIAQCKHYVKSSFSQLLSAAKAEVPKVKANNPSRYIFLTSQSTVETQNKQVYDLFSEWMESIDDVWNVERINDALHANPGVETRHLKLWLHTGLQLFWATNSSLHNRSRALGQRVEENLPRFVETPSFDAAYEMLNKENVCLIAGAPGVGKTMLSHALIARLMADGYMPIEISGDIEEGWAALDAPTKQVFLYDDFLGELALSERLSKQEDRRLVTFIREVSKSAHHKLILTTREYILKDAEQSYPLLREIESSHRLILKMPSYSRRDRGRILYNHLFHSPLPQEYRKQLANGAWKKIVDHKGYNPRLIEYATSQLAFGFSGPYLEEFVSSLDNPQELWNNAYENHVGDIDRIILQVMCTHSGLSYMELEESLKPYESQIGPITGRRVNRSLKTLDQTFLRTSKILDEIRISFHSPTVREFILGVLRNDRMALTSVVDHTVAIDQIVRLARVGTGYLSHSSVGGKLPLDLIGKDVSKAIRRLLPVQAVEDMDDQEKAQREHDLSELSTLSFESLLPESWWEEQLIIVAGIWNNGVGTPAAVKNILAFAKVSTLWSKHKSSLEGAAQAVLLAVNIDDDEDWDSTFDIFTTLLECNIPLELVDDFEAYLYNAMESQGMNLTNMDGLISMASDLGLSLAVEELEEHARKVSEYEQLMNDSREGWSSKTIDQGAEADLQTLFDRFLPSPPDSSI
jgi:hypothetical protein